jgi:hypothetical protein
MADVVAQIATSLRHQSSQYTHGICDRCGGPFDPGKAQLANSPGVCGACAIREEIDAAADHRVGEASE